MKNRLQISVRKLVEYVLTEGDLELDRFIGRNRIRAGQNAHKKIQRSRPKEYISEYTVSGTIKTKHFELVVSGRIDGIYIYPDEIIIDEIKTTFSELKFFLQKENVLHWAQAKVYAYLYALEKNLQNIKLQLTYYQLKSKKIREIRKSFGFKELEDFFNNLVSRYLDWADKLVKWKIERDTSIKELLFPFPSYRKGQREMAVQVYRTIRDSGQFLVQAPTGIGKTMAVLFPSIKAIGEGAISKIFYLTARTTGKKAAEKAIYKLQKNGLKLKFLTLTAKDKICFNPGRMCNAEECEYAKGYYDRVQDALYEIFKKDAFAREIIENISLKFKVCPFEFSLYLSLWTDCVVCDYNYAFDPRVKLKRFFGEESGIKEDFTFLIDEAHNLVNRARDMFSAELKKQDFLDVRCALKNKLTRIYKAMGKVNSWFLKAWKECEEKGSNYNVDELPENLYPLLIDFLFKTEKWLSLNIKTGFRENLLNLYFQVISFIRISENFCEDYSTCYEKFKKDLKLKMFCLNPSTQLKEALTKSRSAIFFSATLTPLDYFREILGCSENAGKMILSSPFPQENLKVFLDHKTSTRYRDREKNIEKISSLISNFVIHKKGNYMIYFPSYEYLGKIYESFSQNDPDVDLLIQQPGMTEIERNEFIDRFSQNNERTLIGFAVMGGVFGEGIDLVGERLDGAVVVGVGLPGISFERDLIRDYFNRENKGFEFAYRFPGINRVLQAAGRVIRTENDRGVILLIDDRFNSFSYKYLLPQWWKIIKLRNKQYLKNELDTFWVKI
jgi:DNA excision repair protein ERCC-2